MSSGVRVHGPRVTPVQVQRLLKAVCRTDARRRLQAEVAVVELVRQGTCADSIPTQSSRLETSTAIPESLGRAVSRIPTAVFARMAGRQSRCKQALALSLL